MEIQLAGPTDRLADHRGVPVELAELRRAGVDDGRIGQVLGDPACKRLVAVPDRARLDVGDGGPAAEKAKIVEGACPDLVVDHRACKRR